MAVSIKKLIRWLRAMKSNDPVAGRAYDVIRRILKGCAPSLQSQANDLLALDEDLEPRHWHAHGPRVVPSDGQTAPNPHQVNLMEMTETFGERNFQQPQSFDTLPNKYQDDLVGYFGQDEHLPMPTITFGTPFFTNFDQGAPVINMQDLWGDSITANVFDPGLAGMHISQQQAEEESMLHNPYLSQQQQQQNYQYPRPQE